MLEIKKERFGETERDTERDRERERERERERGRKRDLERESVCVRERKKEKVREREKRNPMNPRLIFQHYCSRHSSSLFLPIIRTSSFV